MVAGHLHFRKCNIKLVDLKATDLQDFYTKQLERVKANSVIHALTESAKGEVTSFHLSTNCNILFELNRRLVYSPIGENSGENSPKPQTTA